jgi:hypothetical protein
MIPSNAIWNVFGDKFERKDFERNARENIERLLRYINPK